MWVSNTRFMKTALTAGGTPSEGGGDIVRSKGSPPLPSSSSLPGARRSYLVGLSVALPYARTRGARHAWNSTSRALLGVAERVCWIVVALTVPKKVRRKIIFFFLRLGWKKSRAEVSPESSEVSPEVRRCRRSPRDKFCLHSDASNIIFHVQ